MATPTKTLRLDPRLRSEIDRMARRSRRRCSIGRTPTTGIEGEFSGVGGRG